MSSICCHLLKSYSRSLTKKCQPVRYMMQKGAYEGEGKTTMTILNRDAEYGLMIDKISPVGFGLNLGVNILGAIIMFPRCVLGWNISAASDIGENSLVLFKVLKPKPDILLLGLDNHYPRDAPFLQDFEQIMTRLKIKYEILPVDKACTTFNFLNAEHRFVVGALMPPKNYDEIDLLALQRAAIRRSLEEEYTDTEPPDNVPGKLGNMDK